MPESVSYVSAANLNADATIDFIISENFDFGSIGVDMDRVIWMENLGLGSNVMNGSLRVDVDFNVRLTICLLKM